MIRNIFLVAFVKAILQSFFGQGDRIKETVDNAKDSCPIINVILLFSALYNGDSRMVDKSLLNLLWFFLSVFDIIPVVGHCKGILHYRSGYTETGHETMKSACRMPLILYLGSSLGFQVGLAAGIVMDLLITFITYMVSANDVCASHGSLINFCDPSDIGRWFDSVCAIACNYFAHKIHLRVKPLYSRSRIGKRRTIV